MIDIEKQIAQETSRRKRYQMRRAEAGLVRINFYVPMEHVKDFRARARELCDEKLKEYGRKTGWVPRR